MIAWLTERLLGDDTRHWPAPARGPLTLDLSRQTLNGVKLGDPADRLRAFGRPIAKRPLSLGVFKYPALGVQICLTKDRRVQDFGVAVDHTPSESDLQPADNLTLVVGSRSVELRAGSRLAEVTDRLGLTPSADAKYEDEEDDEVIETFKLGPVDCEIETAKSDGRVRFVNVYRR